MVTVYLTFLKHIKWMVIIGEKANGTKIGASPLMSTKKANKERRWRPPPVNNALRWRVKTEAARLGMSIQTFVEDALENTIEKASLQKETVMP
jgi:hypothetical protein